MQSKRRRFRSFDVIFLLVVVIFVVSSKKQIFHFFHLIFVPHPNSLVSGLLSSHFSFITMHS